MDCKDCEHGAYDEFINDYICKKNDIKELRFYPDADAPECEYKTIVGYDRSDGINESVLILGRKLEEKIIIDKMHTGEEADKMHQMIKALENK